MTSTPSDLVNTIGLTLYTALKSLAIKIEYAGLPSPSLAWALPLVAQTLPFLPVLEELVFEDEQLHELRVAWFQHDLAAIARSLPRFPLLTHLHIGYRFGEAALGDVERHLLQCARDADLSTLTPSDATQREYPELAGPMILISLFEIAHDSVAACFEPLQTRDDRKRMQRRRPLLAVCARIDEEDDNRLFDAMRVLV